MIFGGPIFDPLIVNGYISFTKEPGMEKLEDGGYAITRRNGLKKNLFEQKNQVVGFYSLDNIQVSETLFIDIQILITDPHVRKSRSLEKVKDWHDMCRKNEKFDKCM